MGTGQRQTRDIAKIDIEFLRGNQSTSLRRVSSFFFCQLDLVADVATPGNAFHSDANQWVKQLAPRNVRSLLESPSSLVNAVLHGGEPLSNFNEKVQLARKLCGLSSLGRATP